MWKRPAKDSVFRPEDYDQPTQPLEKIVFPGRSTSNNLADKFPSGARPEPASGQNGSPQPQASFPVNPYQSKVYPVLPSMPVRRPYGQPPTRVLPAAYRPARLRKVRRNPLPGLLGLFFVLVQLVLLGRVVCLLLGAKATAPWLALLFAASDLFVWPARWLAAHINTSLLAGTQLLTYLEFLVIILAYGLLSRFLERLLKALLNG